MPIRTPWVRRTAANGDKEYLAMVSYFQLRGIGILPKFLWNALRVERQLLRSPGLLGHSSGAKLRSLEFWSITVWEDERALQGFVRTHPHTEIMEAMRPHVFRSEFVRWSIRGFSVPPDPREAEVRLRRELASAG